MTQTDSLVQRLRGLDEDALAALLERRSDVLTGQRPRDLSELAERLRHPQSLVTVLRDCAVPFLQVVEAAQALGDGCTRGALADFLDDSGPRHRVHVDEVVDQLADLGILCLEGVDRIRVPAALAEIFPSPLGLGQPLRVLLRDRPVDSMRRIQATLGIGRQQTRVETVAALVRYFGKPDNVRTLVARAPAGVAEQLAVLAGAAGTEEEVIFDQRRFQRRQSAIEWAVAHGLMVGTPYAYDFRLSAEVARALRGPDYHAPFTPRRPEPLTRLTDRTMVESDSSAAATEFADHALAVLDHLLRSPVPSVKAGGIGLRELSRLAKATAVGEVEARLVLELADSAGLLDRVDQTVCVSDEFAVWRDSEPADRFVSLLSAWWSLGTTPTEVRDADDKALRVLAGAGHCEGCRAARVSVVAALAEIDGGTDRACLAPLVRWKRPLVHVVVQDAGAPFATIWREAEILGVISQGALSQLGRFLLAGELDALREHAIGMLPKSAERAKFGADLTVYVAGAPSSRVSALLDAAATRESRGGAITWRFSPASIRRAMDEGMTAASLITALTEIATEELPQPLRYLVGDVARRHGNVRLTSVACCVRSDDEALIAEIAANRRLAKLGLRVLAPTVLASDANPADILAALRAAGYFPVSEDGMQNVVQLTARADRGSARPSDDGATSVRPLARTQARGIYRESRSADSRSMAAALLRGRPVQNELIAPTEAL